MAFQCVSIRRRLARRSPCCSLETPPWAYLFQQEVFILRAIIIANGQLKEPINPLPEDLVIAADGGAMHCLAHNIKPNYVIGDLDSLDTEHISRLEALGARFIKYPARKDYTDLELALRFAQENGADEVIILAGLGARWDQTIANLMLPILLAPLKVRLLDAGQEICFLQAGEGLRIRGQPGDTVSLIPLAGPAQGITTRGLEYPLFEDRLEPGSTRGISNVLLVNEAFVSLEKGNLLCVIIHNPA
jgi:thiamine pyrophosphokinase